MDSFLKVVRSFWNISPDLITRMANRASGSSYQVQSAANLSLAEIKTQNRWPFWRILLYAYLLFGVLRYWFAAVVLGTGSPLLLEIQQYDVIMRIAIDQKLMTFYGVILFSPLSIVVLVFDYTINVKRYTNFCRPMYELMVINPLHFFTLNPQLKPALFWKYDNPLESMKINWAIFRFLNSPPPLGSVTKIRWAVPVLPCSFRHLNVTTRTRALLLNWFLQLFVGCFTAGTALTLALGGLHYHFAVFWPRITSWTKYLLGIADLTLICFCAVHTFKLLTFVLHVFILVNFVYHCYLKELKGMITLCLAAIKRRQISQLAFNRTVHFFLLETSAWLQNAISSNSALASPLLFYGLFSQFTINLHLVTSIFFTPDTTLRDRAMAYVLVAIQAVVAIGAFQVAIKMASEQLPLGRMLGRLQLYLFLCTDRESFAVSRGQKRSWRKGTFITTGTKLKVLSLYEQLHSNDAFCYTVGPVKITNNFIFEVLCF